MFLLNPTRGTPPRHRVDDSTFSVNGGLNFYTTENSDPMWVDTGHVRHGTYKEMYDVSPGASVNDCWFLSETVTPTITSGKTGWACGRKQNWSDLQRYSCRLKATHLFDAQTLFYSDEVQGALSRVGQRWVEKLTTINPDQLPDMTVFIAELEELNGVFGILSRLASDIIHVLRMIRDRKKLLRWLRHKRGNKRVIRALKGEIAELGSQLLSMRFGVLAPIRDITTILAAMYGYVESFKFPPFREHIREIVFVNENSGVLPFNDVCNGASFCPGCDTGLQYTKETSARVVVSCSVDVQNRLTGTNLEKTLALLLGQLGMLPSLATVWELTRLSWLIDYFFATEKLFAKLQKAAALGPNRPVIWDSCISLSYEITTEEQGYYPCLYGSELGDKCKRVTKHYERLVAPGSDLLDSVRWARSPSGSGSGLNALAFFAQLLAKY